MTAEQFWNLVEKVHKVSGGDMDRKCELLEAELRQLPLDELRLFKAHFEDLQDQAYSWELWAAAYIISGGCSDDKFSDFRSTLISMGRETFERTLADPEWLADNNYQAETADYEGYQYVPTRVIKDLNGGKLFPRSRAHPKNPSGKTWDEESVAELYPKLAKKYNYDQPAKKSLLRRLFGG